MYLNLANAKFDEYGLMSDHVAKRLPSRRLGAIVPGVPGIYGIISD